MASNEKLRSILADIQRNQNKASAKTSPLGMKATVNPLTGLNQQIANADTRLRSVGIDTESLADTRNPVEKALNLTEDQNWLFDIFEVINRPQNAIKSVLEEISDPRNIGKPVDIGEAFMDGLTGEEKDLSYGQVLRNWFKNGQREDGTIDWTDALGMVGEMFLDPADLALIPLTGGLSYLAKAGVKAGAEGVQTASKIASGVQDASKLIDGVVDAGQAVAGTGKVVQKLSVNGFVFRHLGMAGKVGLGATDNLLSFALKTVDENLFNSYNLMKKQFAQGVKLTGRKISEVAVKASSAFSKEQRMFQKVLKGFDGYIDELAKRTGTDKAILHKELMNLYEYTRLVQEPMTWNDLLKKVAYTNMPILPYSDDTYDVLKHIIGEDKIADFVVPDVIGVGDAQIRVLKFNKDAINPDTIKDLLGWGSGKVDDVVEQSKYSEKLSTTKLPKRRISEEALVPVSPFKSTDAKVQQGLEYLSSKMDDINKKGQERIKSLQTTLKLTSEAEVTKLLSTLDPQATNKISEITNMMSKEGVSVADLNMHGEDLIKELDKIADKLPKSLQDELKVLKKTKAQTVLYDGKSFSQADELSTRTDDIVNQIMQEKESKRVVAISEHISDATEFDGALIKRALNSNNGMTEGELNSVAYFLKDMGVKPATIKRVVGVTARSKKVKATQKWLNAWTDVFNEINSVITKRGKNAVKDAFINGFEQTPEYVESYIALRRLYGSFGELGMKNPDEVALFQELNKYFAKNIGAKETVEQVINEGGSYYKALDTNIRSEIAKKVTFKNKGDVAKELGTKIKEISDVQKDIVLSKSKQDIIQRKGFLKGTTAGNTFFNDEVRGVRKSKTYAEAMEDSATPQKFKDRYKNILDSTPEYEVKLPSGKRIQGKDIPPDILDEMDFIEYLAKQHGDQYIKRALENADDATKATVLAEYGAKLDISYPRYVKLDQLADDFDRFVAYNAETGTKFKFADTGKKIVKEGAEAVGKPDGRFARKVKEAVTQELPEQPEMITDIASGIVQKPVREIMNQPIPLGNFYNADQIAQLESLKMNPVLMEAMDEVERTVRTVQEIIGEVEFNNKNAIVDQSMKGYLRHKRIKLPKKDVVEEAKTSLMEEGFDMAQVGGKTLQEVQGELSAVQKAQYSINYIKDGLKRKDSVLQTLFMPGKTATFNERTYAMSALEANNIKSAYYQQMMAKDEWFTTNVPENIQGEVLDYFKTNLFDTDVRASIIDLMDKGASSINYNKRTTDLLMAMSFGDPNMEDSFIKIHEAGGVVPPNFVKLDGVELKRIRKAVEETIKYSGDATYAKQLKKTLDSLITSNKKDLMLERHLYNYFSTAQKRDAKGALEIVDRLNGLFKAFKVSSPAFNIRNATGNPFNMWLSGMNIGDIIKNYNEAGWIAKNYDGITKKLTETGIESLSPKELKAMQIYEEFINRGFINRDAIYKMNDIGELEDFMQVKLKEQSKLKQALTAPMRGNMALNLHVDTQSRMALYLHAMNNPDYIAKLGIDSGDAMDAVRLVLFDPHDLTFFEQDVMKKLIPFYTFTRQNLAFQMKNLTKNSDRYYKVYKGVKSAWQSVGVSWEDLQNYEQNQLYLPMFVDKDGEYTSVRLNLPMSDLFEFTADPMQRMVSSLTPLAKAPIENVTGVQAFTGRPIENYKGEMSKNLPMTKRSEWALGQTGLDVPARVIYGAGQAVGQAVSGQSPLGGLQKTINITSQGSAERNRLSKAYDELERFNDAIRVYKAKEGDLPTVADLNLTPAQNALKKRQAQLSQIQQLIDKYKKK